MTCRLATTCYVPVRRVHERDSQHPVSPPKIHRRSPPIHPSLPSHRTRGGDRPLKCITHTLLSPLHSRGQWSVAASLLPSRGSPGQVRLVVAFIRNHAQRAHEPTGRDEASEKATRSPRRRRVRARLFFVLCECDRPFFFFFLFFSVGKEGENDYLRRHRVVVGAPEKHWPRKISSLPPTAHVFIFRSIYFTPASSSPLSSRWR